MRNTTPVRRAATIGALLLLGLVGSQSTALAGTTVTVNTTADELNIDGDCSLREAIQAANTDTIVDACTAGSGADTVTLPAGTYTLSIPGTDEDANATGDLDIFSDLTINGASATTTILNANQIDRVLHIASGTIEISSVTITNGNSGIADGGGILNLGTLTLTSSTVSGNTAANWAGGIRNEGSLVLIGSTVSGNTASNGQGGGIHNADAGTLLTLTDSTVSGNTANIGAGGIFNYGTVTLTNATISDNIAVTSDGGGIVNAIAATLTLTNSTVSGNTAADWAGGIRNEGSLVLIGSTVSGNTASNGQGGGILNANPGTLTMTNSTVSGNTAANWGGGIRNDGSLVLSGSTVSGNTASNGQGGGIQNSSGTVNIKNTIVAGNTASGPGPDCSGTLTSQGYNLVQDTGGCAIAGDTIGNVTAQDPLLSPLHDYGGPSRTHALLAGSPAIDAGNPAVPGSGGAACAATDQRGAPRADCDIGAFEFSALPAGEVPGLSHWALIVMSVMLGAALYIRRARLMRGHTNMRP